MTRGLNDQWLRDDIVNETLSRTVNHGSKTMGLRATSRKTGPSARYFNCPLLPSRQAQTSGERGQNTPNHPFGRYYLFVTRLPRGTRCPALSEDARAQGVFLKEASTDAGDSARPGIWPRLQATYPGPPRSGANVGGIRITKVAKPKCSIKVTNKTFISAEK